MLSIRRREPAPLAEEGLTAQLTEYVHRPPSSSEWKLQVGTPITTCSSASVPPEEDAKFKSEKCKDEPGWTKKGRRWQGVGKCFSGQELALRQSSCSIL